MLAPAPSRKILRRMDYISDQKGILRRFLREKEEWNHHLSSAGEFILDVLNTHSFNQIVLLGSGWLLDFPIERISKLVQKITLVDVYFPSQIQRKVKNFENVECLALDVTGGYIEAVYTALRASKNDFKTPRLISPNINPEDGKLIISLNILNQLDILLVDYIKSKTNLSEMETLALRKHLQEDHLNLLRPHPFILISDCEELLINTQGEIIESRELIFTDLPKTAHFREWEWNFDSHGLYNPDSETRMKVKAFFSTKP